MNANDWRGELGDVPPPDTRGDGDGPATGVEAFQPFVLMHAESRALWASTGTGYVPTNERLLHAELSRWRHPGLDLYSHGEKPGPLSAAELIRLTGGWRVDRLVYDLTAQATRFVATSDGAGDLVVASAPLDPDVTPARSADVDRWLRLLGGAHAEKLLDWLATVTDLTWPTAAIYLQGPRGAGKGLLASGVARLWGRSRTSYADIMGPYSSALRHCPIVLLDESAGRVDVDSGAFRSLVAESERPLTEKYRPTATLRGCVRLIVAANNGDALRIREDLGPDDEAAIGQRILHIDVPETAGEHLRSIGGRGATAGWVDDADSKPGALPRHIAWLAKERGRGVIRGQRFIVEGEVDRWLRRAGLRGGTQQDILVALARVASEGGDPTTRLGEVAVVFRDGEALVSAERLHRRWSALARTPHTPSLVNVGKALSVLGPRGSRVQLEQMGGGRVVVRHVGGDRILEIADLLGVGDPDRIAETLRHPSAKKADAA